MQKKMGRPSRKGTATTITFNDPDGQIYYFSINDRGKSQLLHIAKVNVGFSKDFEGKTMTPSSSNECLSGCEFPSTDKQNKIINSDVQKELEIIEKFDLFLEKINSHISVDKILRESTFTLNLFPPMID